MEKIQSIQTGRGKSSKKSKISTPQAPIKSEAPQPRTVVKSIVLGTSPIRWCDERKIKHQSQWITITNPFKPLVAEAFKAQAVVIDSIYEILNNRLREILPLIIAENVVLLRPAKSEAKNGQEKIPLVKRNSEVVLRAPSGENVTLRFVSPYVANEQVGHLDWDHPLAWHFYNQPLYATIPLVDGNGQKIEIPGLPASTTEVSITHLGQVHFYPMSANQATGVIKGLIPTAESPTALDRLIGDRQKKDPSYKVDQNWLALSRELRGGYKLPIEVAKLHRFVRAGLLPMILAGYAGWITNHLEQANELANPPQPRAAKAVKKEFFEGLNQALYAISTPQINAAKEKYSTKWRLPYPIKLYWSDAAILVYFQHQPGDKPFNSQQPRAESDRQPSHPLYSLFSPQTGSLFLLAQLVSAERGYAQKVQIWDEKAGQLIETNYRGVAECDLYLAARLHPCQGAVTGSDKGVIGLVNQLLRSPSAVLIPVDAGDEILSLVLPEKMWPEIFLTPGRKREAFLRRMRYFKDNFLGHSRAPYQLRPLNLALHGDQLTLSEEPSDNFGPHIPVEIQASPDIIPQAFLGLTPNIKGEWTGYVVSRSGEILDRIFLPGIPAYLTLRKVDLGKLRFDRTSQSYRGDAANKVLDEIISTQVAKPVLDLAEKHGAQIVVIGCKSDTTHPDWHTISRVSGFSKVVNQLKSKVPLRGLPDIWRKGGRQVAYYKDNLFYLLTICPECGSDDPAGNKKTASLQENGLKRAYSLRSDRFECAHCQKKTGKEYQPLSASAVIAYNGAKLTAADWQKVQNKLGV